MCVGCSLAAAESLTCNRMFCNCPLSDVPNSDIMTLINVMSSMNSNQGMPLSYLAPLSYWKTQPDDRSAAAIAKRIELSYSLNLIDGASMQIAQAIGLQFHAAEKLSNLLSFQIGNITTARALGIFWRYGESSRIFSNCTHCRDGYYYSKISDRPGWPDPIKVATGACSFWDCPKIQFIGSEPNLANTVWVNMIAPLQTNWIRYHVVGKTQIPQTAESLDLMLSMKLALITMAASVGGYYDAPTATPEERLEISVASNMLLLRGSIMGKQVATNAGNGGLASFLDKVTGQCLKLLDGYDSEGNFLAWDTKLEVFRDTIYVYNRTTPLEVTYPEPDAWGPRTQLLAILILGSSIDKAYDNHEGAAFKLWRNVKNRFGHTDGGSNLMGMGEKDDATMSSDISFLAATAALRLARDYESTDGVASKLLMQDVKSIKDVGIPKLACYVFSNTTQTENSTQSAVPRRAYLAAGVKIPGAHGIQMLPPYASGGSSAWAIIFSAAYDNTVRFSPFVLPSQVPDPEPYPGVFFFFF